MVRLFALMLKLRGDSYSDVYISSKEWRGRNKEKTRWNVIPVITLENGQKCWYVKGHIRSRKDNNR